VLGLEHPFQRAPTASVGFSVKAGTPTHHKTTMGRVNIDDLRALAVHESGHAVISQRLGLVVTATEIDRHDGFTFVMDQDRARPNVQLALLMAGVAAEREILGIEMVMRPHDNSDQQRIADVLALIDRRLWPSVLAQARQQAQRMVRVHRGTIFKVANALLERCAGAGEPRARLEGDALAELLGGPAVAILRAAARPK
jgi:hypothetical protein